MDRLTVMVGGGYKRVLMERLTVLLGMDIEQK